MITPQHVYSALVGLLPQIGDALVNLADLGLMVHQQGFLNAVQVLVKVLQHLRGQQHLHFDLIVARVNILVIAGVQFNLLRRRGWAYVGLISLSLELTEYTFFLIDSSDQRDECGTLS